MKKKILIVDDDKTVRESLALGLSASGYEVSAVETGEQALLYMKKNNCPLIILDYCLPGMNGLELLETIKKAEGETVKVIMITGEGDIDTAVKAIKLGASDFITKPVSKKLLEKIINDLFSSIEKESKLELFSRKQQENASKHHLIGNSPEMTAIKDMIRTIGEADTNSVLITGENGTGKELVALSLHENSPRADKSFIDINCTALPENLFESQLFGYEKGAFTNAENTTKGFFELAEGGTIFLDEIGELSLPLQAKLLRVLEERAFYRVGGQKKIELDVMVICATNKDLKAMTETGQFRMDLYYRINLIELKIPALRDRREDTRELAEFFLNKFNEKYSKKITHISQELLGQLIAYDYPGNVRELRNIIERAVILCKGTILEKLDMTPFNLVRDTNKIVPLRMEISVTCFNQEKKRIMDSFEKTYLEKLLTEHGGNVNQAAEKAGIQPSNLSRLISKHKINRAVFKG